jgi:hypothetical protein
MACFWPRVAYAVVGAYSIIRVSRRSSLRLFLLAENGDVLWQHGGREYNDCIIQLSAKVNYAWNKHKNDDNKHLWADFDKTLALERVYCRS